MEDGVCQCRLEALAPIKLRLALAIRLACQRSLIALECRELSTEDKNAVRLARLQGWTVGHM
jgi:hypothetical protein